MTIFTNKPLQARPGELPFLKSVVGTSKYIFLNSKWIERVSNQSESPKKTCLNS